MTAPPRLEIRRTSHKGRGVFTLDPILKNQLVLPMRGEILRGDQLTDDMLAMQIGPDLWLCSDGNRLDDCANHSCNPNTGFLTGKPELFALRNIDAGEEIVWDYSTSLSETGWTLDCACGEANCRKVVRSWGELEPLHRERLRNWTLEYIRHL